MRDLTVFLATVLICFAGPSAGCQSLQSRARQDAKALPPATPGPIKNNTVRYQGVSFTFDSALASEVKSETVPASTDGKPCDIWPEHPSFTLVGYQRLVRAPRDFPNIRVFEIAKFREALHSAAEENGKATIPPSKDDWGNDVDRQVSVLKELLGARPNTDRIKAAIGGKWTGMGCFGIPQIPFLPLWESCEPFAAHVRYINFKNGKGVFFLTQWENETEQITNEGLEYAFQGITNDGKYWVYAEFSVWAPGLPEGDEDKVVAWAEKNYLLDWKTKEFQNYLQPVVAKLQALPADKFQPNLELLERLIQSMEVQPK